MSNSSAQCVKRLTSDIFSEDHLVDVQKAVKYLGGGLGGGMGGGLGGGAGGGLHVKGIEPMVGFGGQTKCSMSRSSLESSTQQMSSR